MKFREQPIDGSILKAYGLAVADMDRDGQADVIVGRFAPDGGIIWYQAPNWVPHLVSDQHPRNITVVAADLTRSKYLDLIVGSNFDRRPDARESYLHWLQPPQAGEGIWTSHLIDTLSMIHRLALAELTPGKPPYLIAASIRGSHGGEDEWANPGSLWIYEIPQDPFQPKWRKCLLDDQVHLNHGLSITDMDGDGRLDILIGCKEGILWYESPADPMNGQWQRRTIHPNESSEVFAVDLDGDGVNEILSVEPWHGNNLVWYKAEGDLRNGKWTRFPIDSSLNCGHSLYGGDVDGDGLVEIVCGYNGPGTTLQLYRPRELSKHEWTKEIIDDGGIGVGQMIMSDMDGDGRLDIVATGLTTNNVKWYRNLTP